MLISININQQISFEEVIRVGEMFGRVRKFFIAISKLDTQKNTLKNLNGSSIDNTHKP